MMMGTAEADIPTQPIEKTTFIEDLSQDQVGLYRAQNYPPGRRLFRWSDFLRIDEFGKHVLHECNHSMHEISSRIA